jgi:hypothetical protein
MKIATASLIPACVLLFGALLTFLRRKTAATLLQLLGAACLAVVVLAHLAEALDILPWMGWGRPDTAGHYLDLACAAAGLTLFPLGYLWQSLTKT